MNHEHRLFNPGGAHLVSKMWKRVQAELLEVSKTLWIDCSRILVIRKLLFAFCYQLFVQRGEEKSSIHRRWHGRHKQAVIGSGVGAYGSRGGVTTQSVRHQPFVLCAFMIALWPHCP